MISNRLFIYILIFLYMVPSGYIFAATSSAPMTLEQCIDIALRQNHDMVIGKEDLNIAQSQVSSAWSTVFPKLTLESGYTRLFSQQQAMSLRNSSQLFSALLPPTMNISMAPDDYNESYSLKISAQQILFGFHVLPAIKAAQYGLDLATDSLQNTEQSVIYSTKEAYFNVLKADEIHKAALESKTVIDQTVQQIRELINAGIATRADLLRLQIQQKRVEQQLLATQNGKKLARLNLNYVLGYPVNADIEPVPVAKADYREFSVMNYGDLLRKAMAKRKELPVLDNQIHLYELQEAIHKSASLPSVFMTGSYGALNDAFSFDFEKNKDWLVAIAAQWKFFDGGETAAKIRETEATINKIRQQKETLVKGIAMELTAIINEIHMTIAQIEAAQAEVELAEENQKNAKERFLAGSATNLEVVDSEAGLLQAKTNLINAYYDFEIARAKLNRAVGESQKI